MSIDLSQPTPRVRPLEEAQALIDTLWLMLCAQSLQLQERDQQIATLTKRVQALEERLRTNSRNSSTPPSADPHRPSVGKSPSGKKRGAQPRHSGKARTLLPPQQITHTHDCLPGPCPACGGGVRITGLCARHQVLDLPPIAPSVTEYRLLGLVIQQHGDLLRIGGESVSWHQLLIRRLPWQRHRFTSAPAQSVGQGGSILTGPIIITSMSS